MTIKAIGDSKKQVVLIMYADAANKIIFRSVNLRALLALMIPLGISLMAVLGFFASNSLSKYLLKAIAALLANTIHNITKMKTV
jgi:hypothetical protein